MKLTSKQRAQMRKTTDQLIDMFPAKYLAERLGMRPNYFSCMKHMGKVSTSAVNLICSLPEVKKAGFSIEKLRPDLVINK